MTKKDILAVANKILGIYLVICAIESLQTVAKAVTALGQLPSSKGIQTGWFLMANIVPFLLYTGMSFCLIKWADPIATRLCPGDITENDEISGIGKDALQETAFTAVGVFVIANALPNITQIIVNLSFQGRWKDQIPLSLWGTIIGVSMHLAFGIYLFFGSRGLVRFLKKSIGA